MANIKISDLNVVTTYTNDDYLVLDNGSETRRIKAKDLTINFPIGYIYLSVDSTDPGTYFGGTWERLKDRFLLGAGDIYSAGATGGEATHTLTIDEIPSHRHTQVTAKVFSKGGGSDSNYEAIGSGYTGYEGGDQPHNNMPPYLVVYMWKRTA